MIDNFLRMLNLSEKSKDDGLDKYYNYEVEDDPMTTLEPRDEQKPVCQVSRCENCARCMIFGISVMIVSIGRALILPEESKLYMIYAVTIAVSLIFTVISGVATFCAAFIDNDK